MNMLFICCAVVLTNPANPTGPTTTPGPDFKRSMSIRTTLDLKVAEKSRVNRLILAMTRHATISLMADQMTEWVYISGDETAVQDFETALLQLEASEVGLKELVGNPLAKLNGKGMQLPDVHHLLDSAEFTVKMIYELSAF